MVGPEGILRGSLCPVASSLMFVPPTSMTRTFGVFPACTLFIYVAPIVQESIRFIRLGAPKVPHNLARQGWESWFSPCRAAKRLFFLRDARSLTAPFACRLTDNSAC